MALFDKVKGVLNDAKGIINDAKDKVTQQVAQMQEEEKRRQEELQRRQEEKQEEERRNREEANRFNPDKKALEWFGSDDGIQTFNQYMTVQSFLFEERIKEEHKSRFSEHDFDNYISVLHKDAKIPYIYFNKLADALNVQAFKKYTTPKRLLIDILSTQAKPFSIDEDGEPKAVELVFAPEEIVSTDKNPVLNFVKNFDCFEIKDDAQGTADDKYRLWSDILIWVGAYGCLDKDIISKNTWIFSKEAYFNDLGTIRKPKGFFKKCIELTTNEEYKAHFENCYNKCE